MKLLIVDDSNMMRKMIESSVKELNFSEILHAADGKAGVQVFKDNMPDVVTLDITMPEMDGVQVLEQMLAAKPDAKVIMVTAVHDKSVSIDAMDKGAIDFINKPFDAAKLKEVLNRVAAQG